jgi:vanillate O-demethylase monooxygenase subunit
MAYVRNAWYVASWSQDITPEKPVAMTILGEPIVIWRPESGNLSALEDRCVHRLAPLSLGRCENAHLRCMYHGLLYDPEGKVVEIPGQEMVPQHARVRRYPAEDRHSWIWVWMGDPARADPALIPPAVGYDDPQWVLGHGQLDYVAEARLINDNLLDFSHLTYVHANSFGSTGAWARHRPTVTPLERGVRVTRWTPNPSADREGADAWSSYEFLVPGVLLMTGGSYPNGTAEAHSFGPPDLSKATSGATFTSQAVTPMDEKSSRYFFSWGPRADQGGAETRDRLMAIAARAFAEDKAMIEAQQRVLDRTPDAKVMPTAHDVAVTMFNRLVERMAKEEANSPGAYFKTRVAANEDPHP